MVQIILCRPFFSVRQRAKTWHFRTFSYFKCTWLLYLESAYLVFLVSHLLLSPSIFMLLLFKPFIGYRARWLPIAYRGSRLCGVLLISNSYTMSLVVWWSNNSLFSSWFERFSLLTLLAWHRLLLQCRYIYYYFNTFLGKVIKRKQFVAKYTLSIKSIRKKWRILVISYSFECVCS